MRICGAALCVVGVLVPQAGCGGGGDGEPGAPVPVPAEWREGAEANESMWRTEVGGAAFGGEVWLAGGFAPPDGHRVADVLIYDPASDSWSTGPALPEAVDHASLVSGDRLYLIGGFTDNGPSDRVWVLDEELERWTAGPALPGPRAAGAAAWDGSRLVYGGGIADQSMQLADDVFALEDGQWRTVGHLDVPRDHLAAASDGQGHVWFLAGRQGNLETNQSVVDLTEGDQVTRVGDVPTARGGVAGFHVPGVGGCVAGGEASNTYRQVECIDEHGTVQTLPDLPQRRHGMGAALIDGVVYVMLGGPSPGYSYSGTVQILELP